MEATAESKLVLVLDDLPDALSQLTAELLERGFEVTMDHRDESTFGNRLIEFRASGRPAVRLVRDRGLWGADVDVSGNWEPAFSVVRALDDAPYSTRAESHDERRSNALAAVDRLPPEGRDLSRVRNRLTAYRREYGRRLGVTDTG